jgi:hypothetical protein
MKKTIRYVADHSRLRATPVAFSLLLCATLLGAQDDTTFKPKDYVPAKTLRTNTYQPKTYTPKPQTPAVKTAEAKPGEFKPLSSTHPLSASPMAPVTPFQGKAPQDQKKVDPKPYTPSGTDHLITITTDKSAAEKEKRTFLVSSNNSPFLVTERPKRKNPLLEPRQGIKVPEANAPAKEPKK